MRHWYTDVYKRQGKVRLRPWAEKGGRIATNATTFNRELLIVEKDNDGKPVSYTHLLMRSVGMSQKQLSVMVHKEGLIVVGIGLILSVITVSYTHLHKRVWLT